MEERLPDYVEIASSGRLRRLGQELFDSMRACSLCPRRCGANRLAGERGVCGADAQLVISGYMRHMGEEPPISGEQGSGTIFFSHCPLRCVFCQNYPFSQEGEGVVYSIEDLASAMLKLQSMGVHNINLVTPEHYLPHILLALDIAVKDGLRIPLVYNTSSYVRKDILERLSGIVDVYLPDLKFFHPSWARRLASAPDYPDVAKESIREMFRQRPKTFFYPDGTVREGVIIRHLVLPNMAGGSIEWINWLYSQFGRDVFISLMSQYYPFYKAKDAPEIDRRITQEEYHSVQDWLISRGMDKGWWQEDYGLDELAGDRIKDEFEV